MDDTFLKTEGIVSIGSKKKIFKILNYKLNEEFGELLFFDYSFFAVPLGSCFSFLCERSGQIISHPFSCKIVMVTQEFGAIYDGIPKGHRTICHVSLDKASYELIHSKIPAVDLWSKLKGEFVLSQIACASVPKNVW